jgi:hypothetical protein
MRTYKFYNAIKKNILRARPKMKISKRILLNQVMLFEKGFSWLREHSDDELSDGIGEAYCIKN